MPKNIFSVPLNPKLTPEQFITFYNFLLEHKEYIRDVYFTCRIAPFMKDAMGDIFVNDDDYDHAIEQALVIQNNLGIPISATFNNIQVPPSQKNLDIFIKNFKPLYDRGIKVATIPHTHWMATGQIKRAFPELYVKNTILRDVRVAAEIVNLAKYGFDYINLDRDLMRDRDTLLRLVEAKKWIKDNLNKEVHYSLLANEGCKGNCPMMVEHFEYNNTREGNSPQYFNEPISRVSCPKWDVDDPSVHLKTANIPPWREDWQELLDDLGVDVFKMHGREAVSRLFETLDIIKRWANNEDILFDNFEEYLNDNNLKDKPINAWRKKIKNCKFDCWECHFCDDIYKIKSKNDHTDLVKHVAQAILDSGVPSVNIKIPGLTSRRVQTLLNLIAKKSNLYMELGSGLGATLCSVLYKNNINAIAIDNWEQNIQPARKDLPNLPDNQFDMFYKNVQDSKGPNDVQIINEDLFYVDPSKYSNVDFWFYDGPHDQESTAKAIIRYAPCLADQSVLIFDDANWQGVVDGAREGVNQAGLVVNYEKIVLGDEEDPNGWWNGLYIMVVEK